MAEQIIKKIKISPIEWETREFETPTRGASWYIIVGLILLVILAYTIYLGRWILAAVVVMVGVVLYLSGKLRPRKMRYRIDETGVKVGDRLFDFDQLKTFWFSSTTEGLKLNLVSTFRLMPVVSIRIQGNLEEKIRAALAQVLPESRNKGEDWIDRINRFLKV